MLNEARQLLTEVEHMLTDMRRKLLASGRQRVMSPIDMGFGNWFTARLRPTGCSASDRSRHGRIATGLSDRAIALIVKRRAVAAGVDPAGYSAHSLRAGCATEAAARGVEERDIGRHTRHRSIAVLRGYIRSGTAFVNNASARLGL